MTAFETIKRLWKLLNEQLSEIKHLKLQKVPLWKFHCLWCCKITAGWIHFKFSLAYWWFRNIGRYLSYQCVGKTMSWSLSFICNLTGVQFINLKRDRYIIWNRETIVGISSFSCQWESMTLWTRPPLNASLSCSRAFKRGACTFMM